MDASTTNLEIALDWFQTTLNESLKMRLGHSEGVEISPLSFYKDGSWLDAFMEEHQPGFEEFVIFMLALAPHLQAIFFNKLIAEHLPEGGDFPEFGGVKGANHRGILPTGETAQFILAGDDLGKRLEIQRILSPEHWFARQRILALEAVPSHEPAMSGRLLLEPEIVELLTV